MTTPLSPQRHKDLRGRHPLYGRLSGEAIWVFMEDLSLSPEQCDAFMAAFFHQMDELLVVMDAMEKQPDMPVRIIGGEAGMPLCPACQQHCGRVLAARSPQWTRHLPPFGIGCPLSLRPLSDTDDGEAATAAPGRDATTPEGILCQCFADNPQHALSRFLARWEVPPDAHGDPSRET